jgi:hypothetical protein
MTKSTQTKLYELLAVETDLKKKAADQLKDTTNLFAHSEKFIGQTISPHALNADDPELPVEKAEMAFTVHGELKKVGDVFGDFMDVTVQKEMTNATTNADVLIEDVVFLKGMTATALLNLESRLEELKKVYEAIPTVDMTEVWEYIGGQGVYVSERRISFRTKKVMRNHVLAQADQYHPAQVQVYTEEVPVYRVEKVLTSGMIEPIEKKDKLDRIDKLARAVKQARQRANDTEITDIEVASKIFKYIENGSI